MNSISFRFALASVSIALLVLALISGANYFFLKQELLNNAVQKAQLIEENSRYKIETLILKTQEVSSNTKSMLEERGLEHIDNLLPQMLNNQPTFFGSALAFNPELYGKEFSPYYYKKDSKILYRDLATPEYDYVQKEWFTLPLKSKNAIWSEPYFNS